MRRNDRWAAALIALNTVVDAATLWGIALFVDDPTDASLPIWLLIGSALAMVVLLVVYDRPLLLQGSFWRRPHHHLADRNFLYYTISRLDWPLLAAGAALLGGLPVAVLQGSGNLLFIPLLYKMTTTSDAARWERIGTGRAWLVVTAFGGAALALAAQYDPTTNQTSHELSHLALGAGLALSGAGCAALSASRFPLAITLRKNFPAARSGSGAELSAVLFVHCIPSLIAAAGLIIVFGIPGGQTAAAGLTLGFLGLGAGIVTRTLGCLVATDLSVNAIAYAGPLVAFAFFVVLGGAPDTNLWMFALAAAVICASNLGLHFSHRRTPQRPGR